MKWCFLLNNAPYLMRFLGKLSEQALKEGDECIVVSSSKITEYNMRKYFPEKIKFLSKPDWCIENYEEGRKDFSDFSWEEFFPTLDRATKNKSFKFNYNKSVETMSQCYQFASFLLQKEKPTLVINEPPVDVFRQILYRICKRNNMAYLSLLESKFNGRIDVYDLMCSFSKYEEIFRKLLHENISLSEKKFAQDFIKDFISHKQVSLGAKYDLIDVQKPNFLKYYIKRLGEVHKNHLRYFKDRKKFKSFDFESETIFWGSFWAPLKTFFRKIKRIYQKNIFKFINNNDKYFLFPLHFQPEASTSVCASFFCDQLATIKNISIALPFPYKLYVKEHFVAFGMRSNDFYKELKKIPNVVLISPYENVKDLIEKSQGVITLTGTIGMEAALAGKRVYVLGSAFYTYHPLCKKLNNFDELRDQLKKDLVNSHNYKNLVEINIRFIISYFRNTVPGSLLVADAENDTNNYKKIYDNIKEKVLEK